MAEMQECKNCHTVYPFTSEFFPKCATCKEGLGYKCKKCKNLQHKQYRARIQTGDMEHKKRQELRRLLLRCAEEMSRERAEKRGIIL